MANLTVVFDLDGTLVDTAPDLVATLNLIFAGEGLPALPYDEARSLIGGGARRMIEHGLKAEGVVYSPADLERLFTAFIAHYAEHVADASRAFPGVEPALDALARSGARLAVCTNKLEWLSRRLLDQIGLSARFAAICGQDTFGVQKPDPIVLKRTIAQAGGDAGPAVMVGDSMTDVRTARAAGVPIIAVDFGYTEVPVAEFNADRVISHFDELRSALATLIRS